MGLDWMQQLGINITTDNSGIQIHNIQLDETETETIEFKNEFKDLFYNNREMKDLSITMKLKDGAQIITAKRTTNTNTPTRTSSKRIQRFDRKRIHEKATEVTEACFMSPALITVKKDKSIEN